MSVLVTFTELGAPDHSASGALGDGAGQVGGWERAAVHCGTIMELVTPAVGPAAGYTFEPADAGPVELPPVWRCGCGFQLDAWIRSPYASHSQVPGLLADHTAALAA